MAIGDMSITANADGLAGVNFVAGGTIDMTSGGDMGFCARGAPDDFVFPVFRLVQ